MKIKVLIIVLFSLLSCSEKEWDFILFPNTCKMKLVNSISYGVDSLGVYSLSCEDDRIESTLSDYPQVLFNNSNDIVISKWTKISMLEDNEKSLISGLLESLKKRYDLTEDKIIADFMNVLLETKSTYYAGVYTLRIVNGVQEKYLVSDMYFYTKNSNRIFKFNHIENF